MTNPVLRSTEKEHSEHLIQIIVRSNIRKSDAEALPFADFMDLVQLNPVMVTVIHPSLNPIGGVKVFCSVVI